MTGGSAALVGRRKQPALIRIAQPLASSRPNVCQNLEPAGLARGHRGLARGRCRGLSRLGVAAAASPHPRRPMTALEAEAVLAFSGPSWRRPSQQDGALDLLAAHSGLADVGAWFHTSVKVRMRWVYAPPRFGVCSRKPPLAFPALWDWRPALFHGLLCRAWRPPASRRSLAGALLLVPLFPVPSALRESCPAGPDLATAGVLNLQGSAGHVPKPSASSRRARRPEPTKARLNAGV